MFLLSQSGLGLESEVALDADLATLSGLGSENHFIALLPALDNKSLAWQDMTGETSIDLCDALGIFRRVLFLNCASAEAVRAETMEDGSLEAAHGRHLWVNMERVPIVAKSVEEGLVLLGDLLADEIWGTLRDLGNARLDGSLISESTETADKERSSHRGAKLLSGSLKDLGVEDHQGTFALVLEIGDVLLNDVFLTGHERLGEADLLFTVKQLHWVEGGDSWNIEVTISERSSVADSQSVGREGLEVLSVLIGELEVLVVHGVLLEADSESVED